MKKTLLSLGTISAAIIPVASVVACGDGTNDPTQTPIAFSFSYRTIATNEYICSYQGNVALSNNKLTATFANAICNALVTELGSTSRQVKFIEIKSNSGDIIFFSINSNSISATTLLGLLTNAYANNSPTGTTVRMINGTPPVADITFVPLSGNDSSSSYQINISAGSSLDSNQFDLIFVRGIASRKPSEPSTHSLTASDLKKINLKIHNTNGQVLGVTNFVLSSFSASDSFQVTLTKLKTALLSTPLTLITS